MKRLQAYKYELMPNGDQLRAMRRFSGSCRFVYNKALVLQKENHEAGNKFIGYVAMAAKLPVWKREAETAWLKETPSQALQHALKDLEKAFKGFFAKRTGHPRFKKKGSEWSHAIGRTAATYKPNVSVLRQRIKRQSTDSGEIPVCRMRLRKSR
jgi:transposase